MGLIKILHYKSRKVVDFGLDKVIINVVVPYNDFLDSILSGYGLFFISKYLFSLYYFLKNK